jgi:membrane protein YqaA with SNARE-associated domain
LAKGTDLSKEEAVVKERSPGKGKKKRNIVRRLYDWVLKWAETPYGAIALFILAFSESSFFPVPPDILLIALCMSVPKKSFHFALNCSIASVLGGAFGYLLGATVLKGLLEPFIEFLRLEHSFAQAGNLYNQYDVWAVGIAGFTPIPFKVFTILGGFFRLDFLRFCIASAVSRSARFFLVSTLIFFFGARIKNFIDRYFNLLAILIVILVVGGFLLVGGVGTEKAVDIRQVLENIDRLKSPDLSVRQKAIIALRADSGRFMGYNPKGSAEERAEAMEKWEEWLEETLDEIEKSIKELESTHLEVRRESFSALQTFSRDNFGYNPEAPLDKRSEAVKKWRQWFKDMKEADKTRKSGETEGP